jgi:ABC-2 type transport system permease protein
MAIFVLLPSILLSGFVFPLEAMPGRLRPVVWFLPMTYYVDGIRALLLKDAAAWHVAGDFAVLATFALVFGAASLARFRKRLA